MEGQRNFDLHRPYADCVILPVECGLRAQCPVLPEGHNEPLNVLQRRHSGACGVSVLFPFSLVLAWMTGLRFVFGRDALFVVVPPPQH